MTPQDDTETYWGNPSRYDSSPTWSRASTPNLGNIGSALTISLGGQSNQIFRVTANTATGTISFVGISPGAEWIVQHQQDATGSRRTVFSGVTWLAGAGAVTPPANSLDVFNFYSPDGTTIYGFQATSPAYGQPTPQQSTAAFETLPRYVCGSGRALSNGFTVFQHFIPDRDLVFGNIETACNGTLGVGATFAKMGIVQYNSGNSYTTIARTASDTTLWTALGYYSRAVVDDGQGNTISSALCRAGQEYALVILVTGTSTAPQLAGPATGNGFLNGVDGAGKLKRICMQSAGSQTDISASYSSISSAYGSAFWGALY